MIKAVRLFVRSVSRACAFRTRTDERTDERAGALPRAVTSRRERRHVRAHQRARDKDQQNRTEDQLPAMLADLGARFEFIASRGYPLVRCVQCGQAIARPPHSAPEHVLLFVELHSPDHHR